VLIALASAFFVKNNHNVNMGEKGIIGSNGEAFIYQLLRVEAIIHYV
jgi:hypothetical protein